MNPFVRTAMRPAGFTAFWVLWPAWFVYFRFSPRRSRVLVRCGKDILLVRSWLGDGSYELPGGGGHFKESLTKAALRELREEVGLILKETELKPLCEGSYKNRGIRMRYVTFLANVETKRRLRLRRFEIADAIWVPIKDVGNYRVRPDVVDSLAILERRP